MVRNHSNGTNGQNRGSTSVPGSNSGRYSRCQNISCLNYPGYIEQVANYTRQVIEQYQPAAVRYDGWQMTVSNPHPILIILIILTQQSPDPVTD